MFILYSVYYFLVFSLLNLFSYYNDLLLSNLDRSMSLNQRNLLSYFNYLKSRHPLMKSLMTLINLIRIVQIPLEMIVAKIAKQKEAIFVLILELSKFIIKFGIWQGSGWRPVPKQFYTSIERRDENNFNLSLNNNNNSTSDCDNESKVKRLEEKMDRLDLQLKESKSKDPLIYYLKGHKSNNFTIQPQLNFKPCDDWKSWTRELTHLARPSVYALCLLIISKGGKSKKNWIPLLVSLLMDLYSKWPELNNDQTISDPDKSPLESEEKARRLLDFLYYPLRSPIYQSITSDILDGVEEKIGAVSILSPVVETIKIYRKLWENVYFYTSAS